MSISSTTVRTGVAVASALLTTVALAPAASAHEDPDRRAKAIGAGWLNSRLDDGLLHAAYSAGDTIEYVDYGTTVEAGYALDAVGRTKLLPRITDALEGTVDSYITGADFGSPDDVYAGPTGKLLAFVADLGGDADPTDFGGRDLVALLEGMTTDAGDDAGRIVDTGASDFANVFGQIWATRALLAVDSPEAPAALDYLLSTRCEAGFFPTYFTDDCATAAPGPDATAFVVILLSDYADTDPELATVVEESVDWLVGYQSKNGAFADDNGVANANSTGIGGWAVGLHDRKAAARKAAVWLRSLQVPGRSCDQKLARQRGAIAYSKAAYNQGRRNGIVALTAGEWQAVAAQALPALAHAPSTHVKLAVDAPEKVKAGGPKVRVRVDGLAQGERACVGIGTRTVTVVGGPEGKPVFAKVAVARPTGKKTVKVLSANATASDAIVAKR